MTDKGPEPVQLMKGKIDYDHYVEKQVKPIADSILAFYDTTFDDLIKSRTQSSLFDF
jgi:DNA polymerase-2